jgi:hypothetical protein
MCHDQLATFTRRAALALLPCLCLAAAGTGCAPAGRAPGGTAAIPDRLNKMRNLRGTGDRRQQARRAAPHAHPNSRPL